MKIIYQSLMVAVIFCVMSCTSTTSYFVTLPPNLTLPNEYRSATIISAFDSELLDFNQEKKIDVFANGSSSVVNSLAEFLEDRNHISVIISDSVLTGRADIYHQVDSIDLVKRTKLSTEMNTDFLIVLESYSLGFDRDVDVEKNDDGSKTRTAYYDLITGTSIHLYDKEGKPFDKWFHEKVYVDYDERQVISGLFAVGPMMRNARKEVNQLSDELAETWVARLSPSELEVVKSIYTHKSLRSSNRLLIKRDWQSAIPLLELLTKSEDYKVAGKAAHNLSVAFEAIDDLESSEKWKKYARQKLGENHISE